MNKTSIKIIKRKDAEAAIGLKPQDWRERKSEAAVPDREKIERSLSRQMANTVSNWIAARREARRVEEVSALRKLFGDELLPGRLSRAGEFSG